MLATLFLAAIRFGQPFFFVRHGETEANSSGRYSSQTLNRFSAKGEQEVRSLTSQLLKMPRFDLILVSPAPRTLRTIAPYLQKTGQKAMVWPLLYECCTGKRPPGVKPAPFNYSGSIRIPNELTPYFVILPGQQRLPNAPTYAQGLSQVAAAVAEFNQRFRNKRVLMVGHSGEGGHMIHELTGRWIQLKNAELKKIDLP